MEQREFDAYLQSARETDNTVRDIILDHTELTGLDLRSIDFENVSFAHTSRA